MALVRFMRKTNSTFLRSHVRSAAPASSFQTSSINHKSFFDYFYKPEYDENGEELGYPSEEDLAAGMWKKEIEARKAGIVDPFDIGAISREDRGTKIDPIRVPSAFESRVIGCKCHPDQLTVYPMWLHQNEPKRCRCGLWMVLYYKEPFVDYSDPQ